MVKLQITRRHKNSTHLLSPPIVRRRSAINSIPCRTRVIKSRSSNNIQTNHASNNRNIRCLSTNNRISNTRQLINRCRFKFISSNTNSNRALHLSTKRISQMSFRRIHQFRTNRNRNQNRPFNSNHKPGIAPLRNRQFNRQSNSPPS